MIFNGISNLFHKLYIIIILIPLFTISILMKEAQINNIFGGVSGLILKTFSGILEKIITKICTDEASTWIKWCNSKFQSNKRTNDSTETLLEALREIEPLRQLSVLVVGKNGSGKKSTVSSFAQKVCTEYHGNSRLKYARNTTTFGRKVYALICKCLRLFTFHEEDLTAAEKTGFHAVLYCFKFKNRLTNDDMSIIEALKSRFGPSIVKNSMILAMTDGEDFWRTKEQKGYDDFKDFLDGMEPCILKDFLKEINKRCVIFENKSKLKNVKAQQAVALFKMIEDIIYETPPSSNKSDSLILQERRDELGSLLQKDGKENRRDTIKSTFIANGSGVREKKV